ncbi:MAG: sterol carrier protein, partial [Actinomycetota bacterium]
MAIFPSAAWIDGFADAINASEAYRSAAATWEGAIAFVFEAEPDRGVPDDVWALLDLWHGACREARIVDAEEGGRAPYVIRAPYSR